MCRDSGTEQLAIKCSAASPHKAVSTPPGGLENPPHVMSIERVEPFPAVLRFPRSENL